MIISFTGRVEISEKAQNFQDGKAPRIPYIANVIVPDIQYGQRAVKVIKVNTWQLYPEGKPVSFSCLLRSYRDKSGQTQIQFEEIEPKKGI